MDHILPWFSPRLSQSMVGVLSALGHTVTRSRGTTIYSSPGLFDKLMYVKSGFVAKALLDPIREEPLLLSLSARGALCGGFENLYVRDRLQRRHYCLTTTEILIVNQDLLLRIADQNPEWQRELSGYSSVSALCDRMGVLVNHSGEVEERLGALLLLMLNEQAPEQMEYLSTPTVEWVELPFMPGLKTISILIDAGVPAVRAVIEKWAAVRAVRYRAGRIWLNRAVFQQYWLWVTNIIEKSHSYAR